MLHQTSLFLGQFWQLFEVSHILDFYGILVCCTKALNRFAWKNFLWESRLILSDLSGAADEESSLA